MLRERMRKGPFLGQECLTCPGLSRRLVTMRGRDQPGPGSGVSPDFPGDSSGHALVVWQVPVRAQELQGHGQVLHRL